MYVSEQYPRSLSWNEVQELITIQKCKWLPSELTNFQTLVIGSVFIFFLYALLSLSGYFYLGDELLLFDYKNIIFSYGITFVIKFLLNFLTICIIVAHMCIKFRTLKQKATIMIRNENRDSNIWHIFIITVLHIIQVTFFILVRIVKWKDHNFVCSFFLFYSSWRNIFAHYKWVYHFNLLFNSIFHLHKIV